MAKRDIQKVKVTNQEGMMGFVLFTAFVGALIYFVQQSEGFWGFIAAVLKAIVWPAFLLHEVLTRLQI